MLTDSLPGFIERGKYEIPDSPVFNLDNSIDYQIVNDQEKVSALIAKTGKVKIFSDYFCFLPPS